VAGIGAFVALTVPGGHAGHTGQGGLAGLTGHVGLAAAALAVTAMPFAAAGLAAAGRRRAILLAVAAGLADACIAVATMAFTHALSHGLGGALTSWATYVLMLGGPCSFLLTQTAYQAGRPMITLPVVSVVTPMASLAVGIGLLGETTRLSVSGAVAVAVAVLVTATGLATLARIAAEPVGARDREAPRLSPQARRFLAGACIPAAGNISFWTYPSWNRPDARTHSVPPAC
jgi:hypothetical protein